MRSQLALGRAALAHHDFPCAVNHFAAALTAPPNLGEAKHLLANQSDIHYWLGCAFAELGDKRSARQHWLAAATFKGDFQEMSVRAVQRDDLLLGAALGRSSASGRRRGNCSVTCWPTHDKLQKTAAQIDYFATSLPTMLIFDDDLQSRQETTALFLQAQAQLGLGQRAKARALLKSRSQA